MPVAISIQPPDRHNERLVANVHPSDWRNPKPPGRYNMVVIGAGAAGLVTAAGDVCMAAKFTHAADAAARIVLANAMFFGRRRLSALTIPHCTYTDPEVAGVGLTAEEARRRGVAVETFTEPLAEVDRAITDGQTEGFVRVHVAAGTDRIVGATLVAAHAGEMINELTLAIGAKIGLKGLSSVIHPDPTVSAAIGRVADHYRRTRFTPFVQKVFRWLLKRRRGR